MKIKHQKIVIVISLLLTYITSHSQTPGPLEIIPSNSGSTLIVGRKDGNPSIKSSQQGSGHLILDSEFSKYVSLNHYTPDNVVLAYGGGKVGIGVSNPETKLHIKGDGVSLRLSPSNYASLGAEIGMDFRQLTHNGAFRNGGAIKSISTDSYTGGVGTSYDSDLVLYSAGDGILVEGLRINSLGNIGIGTLTTGSHKLAVDGSIGAREIKVEVGTWSDFVFYKDYKLPTLKEVETHINEKGHLQDIPSEKDVEENGINLGEMNAKLLLKIEELTLYTIQQEKKLNKLEKENQQLKSLSDRLTEIEKLLE